MDPISIGIMAIGTGLDLFGKVLGMGAAKKEAALNKQAAQYNMQIAQNEMKVEEQKRNAMRLDASRKQIENIRSAQLARSMAVNNAVNQNAQFGTGLSSGLAQITGRANWNAEGIESNLEIGENIFGINKTIGDLKVAKAALGPKYADAQEQAAMGQGLSSLGGSLVKNGGTIGSLGQTFFGGFGGGSKTSLGALY